MAAQAEEDPDVIDWNTKQEIQLLQAMTGYKPVGVNRHFMMACIHNKLSKALNREITSEPIWKHFDTMYNMEALHESAIVPFPNEQSSFKLSEDFKDLFYERLGVPFPSEKSSDAAKSDEGKKSGNSGKVLCGAATSKKNSEEKSDKNESELQNLGDSKISRTSTEVGVDAHLASSVESSDF